MAVPFGISVAEMLLRELQAQGLPVVTVSCGDTVDRSTWVVTLSGLATPQQIAAAETIRATYDPKSSTSETNDRIRRRDKTLWTPQITALTRAVHQRLRDAGVDQIQMSVFRAAIEAEYDLIITS